MMFEISERQVKTGEGRQLGIGCGVKGDWRRHAELDGDVIVVSRILGVMGVVGKVRSACEVGIDLYPWCQRHSTLVDEWAMMQRGRRHDVERVVWPGAVASAHSPRTMPTSRRG